MGNPKLKILIYKPKPKEANVYDNGHGVHFCGNCHGSVWQMKHESNYCFRCGYLLKWDTITKS